MKQEIDLSKVFMHLLCEEIEKRPDVETIHVAPYETVDIPAVTGAATVYIVAN